MKIFSSICSLAYLAIVVSALTTAQQADQNPLVMNENVLTVTNSVITDPVEAINHIDVEEVCNSDSGLVGQLAVNDPECYMVRVNNDVACESDKCLGVAEDDDGGWCRYKHDTGRCCMEKMRGANVHISCLACKCKKYQT